MPTKRYSTEQIVSKLRQAEVELSRGLRTPQVCKKLGSASRRTIGGEGVRGLAARSGQAAQGARAREHAAQKLVADQALDHAILKEVTSGNF